MPNLPIKYKQEAAKDQNRPIELYDFYLGSQDVADAETYYFCTDNTIVKFWNLDGVLKDYLPMSLRRSAIPTSSKLEIDAITGEFDNVDFAWSHWLATVELRGKKIVIRRVFLDLLTDATQAKILFSGIINRVRVTEEKANLECRSRIKSLEVETGVLQQLYCGYIFGDIFCALPIPNQLNQTIDAGSTTTEIIDAARTEVDDWWNDGLITFIDGENAGEERKVVDFIAATDKIILDFSLPKIPVAGDRYNIERGCDKSYDVCKNRYGNQANFGGFRDIPQLINPRVVEQ